MFLRRNQKNWRFGVGREGLEKKNDNNTREEKNQSGG
jgi:hypothetical protein